MSYYSGSPRARPSQRRKITMLSSSRPVASRLKGVIRVGAWPVSTTSLRRATSWHCLGRSTSVRFPKKRTTSLGLTSSRPYLILQVYLPIGRPFTCEVVVSDDKLTRRRLIFSTAFKEELYGELHAQISLQNLERGKWLNLCINMLSLHGYLLRA